jgi:hypothetical protein
MIPLMDVAPRLRAFRQGSDGFASSRQRPRPERKPREGKNNEHDAYAHDSIQIFDTDRRP